MKPGLRLAGAAALIACMGSFASAEISPTGTPQILRPQILSEGAIVERAAERLNVKHCEITRLEIVATPGVGFHAELPIEGEWVTIEMQPHTIRGENYRVLVQGADGLLTEVEPGVERNFRGSIEGVPGSVIAGSVLEDGLDARIIMPDGRSYLVAPMKRYFLGSGVDEYVIFRGEDYRPIGGVCGNDHHHEPPAVGEGDGIIDNGSGDCGGLCVAQLGCDADVEYYQDFGSSVTNVENRINALINQVNPPYENQIGITHQIEAIIVRTAEPDPYSTTNSTNLVGQVRSEWSSLSATIEHDVAHLFTGKEIDGSTIGEADTIGGICTSQRYAYSQAECCGSTGCAVDLITHELGHLWGGVHCSCPSNFMTTPLSCAATSFTSSNQANMVNHRNSRTCLDPDLATVMLPFFDNFSSGLGAPNWAASGATASTAGNGEPSAPNSARIRGTQSMTTAPMNTVATSGLMVSYWWQRTGSGNSPENGEDLIVEYRTNSGGWQQLAAHPGAGSDTEPFHFASFSLTDANAYHNGFRLRFRNPLGEANSDDFFVDDVSIDGNLVLPGSFNLLTPTNGATGVSQSPLFLDWSNSSDAANYTVQVDNNSNFSSPEINLGATIATQLNIGSMVLTDGETYFWRVIANNANGSTNSTPSVATFTIGTPATPPGAFNLLTPANGATGVSQSPSLFFDWQNAADADSYELDVDNNSNFASPEIALTGITMSEQSIGGEPLTDGLTYFWRVRAVNAEGTTLSTPASASFTLQPPPMPPGAFGLVSPSNGAIDVSQDPTLEFDWNDSTGADAYDLLVDDNSDFSSPEIDLTGLTTSDASVGGMPLSDGTAYFWRVIANNADGSTTSTPASFNFTTETPVVPCPGDVAGGDGMVNIDDLNSILAAFNTSVGVGNPLDLANDDGFVDIDDLNVILANFGNSCP